MISPFPGMDPYLENPVHWQSIHNQVLTWIYYQLAPQVEPNYFVMIEERVYVSDPREVDEVVKNRNFIPDVSVINGGRQIPANQGGVATLARPEQVRLPMPETVRELYLEIRDTSTHKKLVTVLEILSPTNKRPGKGRDEYLTKRNSVLSSRTHLVEIDLLRAGQRMPIVRARAPYDYSILVSRHKTRDRADFYPFRLRDPFPRFPLPLRADDTEPVVDLRAVLDEAYDRGRLNRLVNYEQDPVPVLPPEDMEWAAGLLREKGLR